jgi:hypothetical protein
MILEHANYSQYIFYNFVNLLLNFFLFFNVLIYIDSDIPEEWIPNIHYLQLSM